MPRTAGALACLILISGPRRSRSHDAKRRHFATSRPAIAILYGVIAADLLELKEIGYPL